MLHEQNAKRRPDDTTTQVSAVVAEDGFVPLPPVPQTTRDSAKKDRTGASPFRNMERLRSVGKRNTFLAERETGWNLSRSKQLREAHKKRIIAAGAPYAGGGMGELSAIFQATEGNFKTSRNSDTRLKMPSELSTLQNFVKPRPPTILHTIPQHVSLNPALDQSTLFKSLMQLECPNSESCGGPTVRSAALEWLQDRARSSAIQHATNAMGESSSTTRPATRSPPRPLEKDVFTVPRHVGPFFESPEGYALPKRFVYPSPRGVTGSAPVVLSRPISRSVPRGVSRKLSPHHHQKEHHPEPLPPTTIPQLPPTLCVSSPEQRVLLPK